MRLRYLLRERDMRGHTGEQVLSVYRDLGVVPKADRTDNFNKTPEDLSNYKLVLKGDLVVNKMKAWQGSIAVSDHQGIVSGDYLVCHVLASVHSRYLHHALRSRPLIAEYAVRSKGIRPSQWRLYWDDMSDIDLNLPTIDCQRAVADFLDTETARIDALVAKKRELSNALSDRRTSTGAAAVAGTRLGGPRKSSSLTWLDDIPADWDEVMLKLVAQVGTGHTPSRNRPEWWVDCNIPWVTTGEVAQVRSDRIEYLFDTREMISQLGIENSSAVIHPKDTVVLCRTASAGYSGIMGTDMATSQDFVTWVCGPLLRPRYLLLCLRAMRRDLLDRLATGSTHKTIYMPDIDGLRIPLPPVTEQDQIVDDAWACLRKIDAAADHLERQIVLLQEHKQAMITAAVTGELEVPGMVA